MNLITTENSKNELVVQDENENLNEQIDNRENDEFLNLETCTKVGLGFLGLIAAGCIVNKIYDFTKDCEKDCGDEELRKRMCHCGEE